MEQNEGNFGSKYRMLVSDIIIFISGTVLAKAIQFLLMPLYTTYMTTEAYGVAELTNNLSELFFPIVTLCIYEAAFRFAIDTDFDNDRLVACVVKVMGGSLIIGFLVSVFCRFVIGYEYAFYLYFILYSYSIRMCAAYYMRGRGYSKAFALSGIVNALTLSFFNLFFLVYVRLEEVGYLLSIGLSYCCSAIYLLFYGRIDKAIIRSSGSKKDLAVLFKYCVPLIFYNILYWVTAISGRYILLWFSNSAVAGKYVAAIKISAVINMIQQSVYAAVQLNSSRVYVEENRENYYSKTINLFIVIYCTFGSIIICMTPLLAKFTLKNDFYDARIYLPVIMFGALINCISSLFSTIYTAYKKTQRMIGVSVVGAGINVFFSVLLLPGIGVWGVCIASVLCYFSQVVYKFADVKVFCKIKYNWKCIMPNIIILTIQIVVMSLELVNKFFISLGLAVILVLINISLFYKKGISGQFPETP